MKKNHLAGAFALTLALAIFGGCKPNGYTVSGTFDGAASLSATLEQMYFNNTTPPTQLGKASCDGSGHFKIEEKEALKAGIYRLTLGAKRLYFILDGSESALEFKGNVATMDKMDGIEIIGSPTAKCFLERNQELATSAQAAGGHVTPESFKAVADKACTPLMKAAFYTQLMSSQAAATYAEDFKKLGEEIKNTYPNTKYASDFATNLRILDKKMNGGGVEEPEAAAAGPIKIGQEAPEIALPDPAGKVRKLSALRGKVVLLDFWASWCRPCRAENPNVVAIYKKYKDKGFEIYSVSLDGVDTRRVQASPENLANGKTKWQEAIATDGLTWENHVSDLKNWGSAAAQAYGVQSIPAQFLIDKQGKIVSTNTRGKLEDELKKLL